MNQTFLTNLCCLGGSSVRRNDKFGLRVLSFIRTSKPRPLRRKNVELLEFQWYFDYIFSEVISWFMIRYFAYTRILESEIATAEREKVLGQLQQPIALLRKELFFE